MSDKYELSAQDVAKLTGESYSTIDHWTNAGILICKRRGRTRYYAKESMKRCSEIRKLQNEGHSLVTIRQLLT